MSKLNENIVVQGVTDNSGIKLLTKRGADSKSKCITYSEENKVIGKFEQAAQATTFNAFYPVNEKQSDILISLLNQRLRDSDIKVINEYLR